MKNLLFIGALVFSFHNFAEQIKTEAEFGFSETGISSYYMRGPGSDFDSGSGITARLDCEVKRTSTVCKIDKFFQGDVDGIWDDLKKSELSEIILDTSKSEIVVNDEVIGRIVSTRQNGTPAYIYLDPEIVRYSESDYKLFIAK